MQKTQKLICLIELGIKKKKNFKKKTFFIELYIFIGFYEVYRIEKFQEISLFYLVNIWVKFSIFHNADFFIHNLSFNLSLLIHINLE